MKTHDRERIIASFTLALLVHLVLGVVLYFTAPWTVPEDADYRPPVRVVFDQPEPPVVEPEEAEPEEPDPPEVEPEPEPEPPEPEPTPQVERAPAPEPVPQPERQAPQQQQPQQQAPATAQQPWDIPTEEPAAPAAPRPQRSLSREELRGETIPEGTDGEFLAQQQEQMRREFEALSREIDRIEELQEQLLAARERESSSGETSSPETSDLQRRLDQALADLSNRGEEDAGFESARRENLETRLPGKDRKLAAVAVCWPEARDRTSPPSGGGMGFPARSW